MACGWLAVRVNELRQDATHSIAWSTRTCFCVSRALRGRRGKEEPRSAIAMVLQAALGNDGLGAGGATVWGGRLRLA